MLTAAWIAWCTVSALTIEVDYRYDTNDFFSAAGNPEGAVGATQARAALEAAAARWSGIIDQSLGAVSLRDDNSDVRIGFNHPGTGASYQVSAARSAATDALAGNGAADEYRGPWSIPADTWILYAGGRMVGSVGLGGTGTGLNYTSVFDDPDGVHNRGFNVGFGTLPVWGGAITFRNASDSSWHFDHTTAAALGKTDFYTIALHEIGHALGLSARFDDWENNTVSGYFTGGAAVAAYNADNGTAADQLFLQPGGSHWDDGRYDSVIFPAANPNYAGTVGPGSLQDLLMEPIINFSYPDLRRFEVTNVEVGALRDMGWGVIDAGGVLPGPELIAVSRTVAGQVSISWSSEPGAYYTVQTSLDLQTWSDVTPAVPSGGSRTSWIDGAGGYVDPNPSSSVVAAKYYRVQKN